MFPFTLHILLTYLQVERNSNEVVFDTMELQNEVEEELEQLRAKKGVNTINIHPVFTHDLSFPRIHAVSLSLFLLSHVSH